MAPQFVMYSTASGGFRVTNDYKVDKELGTGGFGVVCSAIHNPTSGLRAIKQVKLHDYSSPHLKAVGAVRLLREIKALQFFRHENIVTLHDIIWIPDRHQFDEIYLVMDLMDSDLHGVIQKQPSQLGLPVVRRIMYQILDGVECIHRAGMMHRDLKPTNILVNTKCELKICDFGLAREMRDDSDGLSYTRGAETRWYRSPEGILAAGKNNQSRAYNEKVDIWSVGCILAELLLRKPLFMGNNTPNQMQLIVEMIGLKDEDARDMAQGATLKTLLEAYPRTPPLFNKTFQGFDPTAVDLLKRLLEFNPAKRISAAEALTHPFFEDECEDDEEKEEGDMEDDEDFPGEGRVASATGSESMDCDGGGAAVPKFDPLKDTDDDQFPDFERAKQLLYTEMLHFHPG